MAEIHRLFRAGFTEGPGLVNGVKDGDTSHAEVVAGQLEILSIASYAHHEGEETTIVPVVETTLTEDEVERSAKHGRKATPKGQIWNQLGAILAAQPDVGDEWLHKDMPSAARPIWRAVGKRRYKAHREALAGR
ncbi:MAG: hypothetical protein ABIW81_04960 [Terrimesophilobacter sp.]